MISAPQSILPFVTVIVPTYRDWDRMALCLKALEQQRYPAHSMEIIIANNDPKDPCTIALPANAQVIAVAKPGSYAARNAALRIARGSIIGFTDSDCIPETNWVENAVQYLAAHPGIQRVAGLIRIFYQQPKPTAAELYNAVYAFQQELHVRDRGTSVTANLFTYRDVFDRYGYFDEQQLSLGDLLWGKEVYRQGCTVAYVPGVVVAHPARSFRELVTKEKRVGGGQGIRQRGKTTLPQQMLSIAKSLLPRKDDIGYVLRRVEGMSLPDKIKVLALRHYLVHIRTRENMRVALGKEPNRA